MTINELARPWVAGLGMYEPGRPIEEVAREMGFQDASEIIKLASNENALGPSPKAVAAMKKAARQMHLYPDGGAFYLRQALGKKLNVSPDQIITGSGSNELIEFLGHVFLDSSTSIVMADRAFVVYKLVADMFRARTIKVPMQNFTHDLDAMLAAITPDTRVVFVSNPNNPTGTMVDQAALDRFMERVPDHVLVAFDEAYIELLPPALQPDCIKYVRAGRKVIVLRTFSKTYGLAGLRIGYGVASEDCIKLLQRVRQPFNTTAMAQVAAIAALDDDEFVERTRAMTQEGVTYLQAMFSKMKLEYVPTFANFIMVKVGPGRKIFDAMQRAGVIVRPMDPYGLPEYIRITIGTRAENKRCISVLKKVLKEA
ncbi:MAG: histidinol-phosphate transaminase [bacterium]|jgi:histidinol-phosphate aminotransferase